MGLLVFVFGGYSALLSDVFAVMVPGVDVNHVAARLEFALTYRGQTIYAVQTNSFTVWPSQFFIFTDCEEEEVRLGRCNPRVVEGDLIDDVVLNAADAEGNTLEMIEARDGVSVITTLEQCSIQCLVTLDPNCDVNERDAATVTIAAGNAASMPMTTLLTGAQLGDARPMVVLGASFVVKNIAQNTSLPRATNAITVTLAANVEISGAFRAEITLSGLIGTLTPDADPFTVYPLPWLQDSDLAVLFSNVTWTQATGSLVLTLASDETIDVGTALIFRFVVVNDDFAQEAPEITVQANGEHLIQPATMQSAANQSAPMLLAGRSFVRRFIGQTTPFPGALNTVGITLAASVAIYAGDVVSITGLSGSQTPDTSDFSPFGFSSSCLQPVSWAQDSGTLVLQFSQDVIIDDVCSAQFELLNPSQPQPAQQIMIALPRQYLPIDPQSMVHSTEQLPWRGSNGDDAGPLKVNDRAITYAKMAQSSPYPSATNTLTLTLAANVALQGQFSVNISNLAGATLLCPVTMSVTTPPLDPPQISTANLDCCVKPSDCAAITYGGILPSSAFFCASSESSSCLAFSVNASTASVLVSFQGELSAGQPLVLSWDITNPSEAQTSPTILARISTISTAFIVEGDVSARPMPRASDVDSAMPLRIIEPGFPVRSIGQSSSWPGALNNVTATLVVNRDLAPPANISILGIPMSILVDTTLPSSLTYDTTSSSGSTLVFDSLTTISAGTQYVITMLVRNPTTAQASPDISVLGRGACSKGCSLGPQNMDKDSITLLPLTSSETGNAMPLLVQPSSFVVKQFGHSSPYPSALNTITGTLVSNRKVAAGSRVRLLSLTGTQTTIAADLNLAQLNGADLDGSGLAWAQTSGTLTLTLAKPLEAGRTYVFSFEVINPTSGQAAPDVMIDCVAAGTGSTLIEAASVVGDTSIPPGVLGAKSGDAVPLSVQDPGFALREIYQSTTFPSAINMFSVVFSTNVDLASNVTISGLQGSATESSATLPFLDALSSGTGSIFSGICSAFAPCGDWKAETGTFTLVLGAGEILRVGVQYSLQFELMNPASSIRLRQTFVEGWAGEVCQGSNRLVGSPFTQQLDRGIARFTGLRIRGDAGIFHFRLAVVDATDTTRVYARVLSDPFTVFPAELRLRSGLSADFYLVNRDWWNGAGAELELAVYSSTGVLLGSVITVDGIEVRAQLLQRGQMVSPSKLGGHTVAFVDQGLARFTDLRFVGIAGRDIALRFFILDSPNEEFVMTEAIAVVPSVLHLEDASVDDFVRGRMTLREIQVQAMDGRGIPMDGILSSDEFYVHVKLIAGGLELSAEKLHGTASQLLVSGATRFTDLSIVGAFGSDFELEFVFTAPGLSVTGVTIRSNMFTIVPIDASIDFDASGLQIVDAVLPPYTVTLLDSNGNTALQSGGSQFVFRAHLYHHGALAEECFNGTASQSPVNGIAQFDDLVVIQSAGTNFSIEFMLFRMDGSQAFATGVSARSETFAVVPYRIQAKLASQTPFHGAQIDQDQRGRITSLSLQIDIADRARVPGIVIEAVDTQNRVLDCSFSPDFPVVAAVFMAEEDVTAQRLTGGLGVGLGLPDSSATFTDLVITSRDDLLLRFYLANVPCSFGSNCYDVAVSIVPFAAIGPHIASASSSQPVALQRFFANRSPTPSLSWAATSSSVGSALVEERRVDATFAGPSTMVERNVFCGNGGTASCPGTPQGWEAMQSSVNESVFQFSARPLDLEDSQLPLTLVVKRTQDTELLYGLAEQQVLMPTEFSLQVRGSSSSLADSRQSLAAQQTFQLAEAPPSPQAAVVDRYIVSGTHARFKASDFEPNSQTWLDSSGNGRSAIVMEGFAELSQAGSDQTFAFVSGSADDFVLFPSDTLPDTATICSLARTPSALSGQAHIAVPAELTWEHGLYVNASWLDVDQGWSMQCGQNAGLQLRFRSNATADFEWSSGSSVPLITQPDVTTQLSINPSRSTAWEIAEVVVWSRALTLLEMSAVMEYYKSMLANVVSSEPTALDSDQVAESVAGYCATRSLVPCLAPSASHVCSTGSTSLTGRSDAYDGSYRPSVGATLLQGDYNAGDTVLRVASVAAIGLTGDGVLRQPVPIYVGADDNALLVEGYDSTANTITVQRDSLSRAILADGSNMVVLTEMCDGASSEVVVVAFQPTAGSEQIVFQMSENGTEREPAVLACPNSYGTQQADGTCQLAVALDHARTMTYYAVEGGVASAKASLTFPIDACKRNQESPCARNHMCINNPDAFSSHSPFCIPKSPFSPVCTVSWPELLPHECAFSLRSPSGIYGLVILSNGTMHVRRVDDGTVTWSAPTSPISNDEVAVLRMYEGELRLQAQSSKVHLYPAVQHHALNVINKFEIDDNGTLAGYMDQDLRWHNIRGDAAGQGYGCHDGECCFSDRLAVDGTKAELASDTLATSGIGCNHTIVSANGLFALRLGPDGSLSLNSTVDGALAWRSARQPTPDPAGYVLRLFANGSVAVRSITSGEHIWPAVANHPVRSAAAFVVENDGTLAAYDEGGTKQWVSIPGDENGNGNGCGNGTCCWSDRLAVGGAVQTLQPDGGDAATQAMPQWSCNNTLRSSNGRFWLNVGFDNALGLYASAGTRLWSFNTSVPVSDAGLLFSLAADGFFSLFDASDTLRSAALWPTSNITALVPVVAVAVDDDGQLRGYMDAGTVVWSADLGSSVGALVV